MKTFFVSAIMAITGIALAIAVGTVSSRAEADSPNAAQTKAKAQTPACPMCPRMGGVGKSIDMPPAMKQHRDMMMNAELSKDDAHELCNAIEGESCEVDTIYREFAEQAAVARDANAAARFAEVGRDEMEHRDAFKAALQKLEAHMQTKGAAAMSAGASPCVTIRAKKLSQRQRAAIRAG